MKKWQKMRIMEFITNETFLHIGIDHKTVRFFVVLNSNPNEQKPVWMGVACWFAQLLLFMVLILGFLATGASLAEGWWIAMIISATATGLSAWGLSKLDGIFQKRPSWDQEDYVPTDEEWNDWDCWVHCEEEYQAWEN